MRMVRIWWAKIWMTTLNDSSIHDGWWMIWELGMMMLLEYWIYYSVLSSDYYVRMYGKKYTNVINWTYVQNSEFNFERWKRTNGKNAHSYQANLHRISLSCGYCYRQQIAKNTKKSLIFLKLGFSHQNWHT